MAWIWFSCFCCASENFRVMLAALAASLTESVLAERHPDSEPTCEKPRVIVFGPPLLLELGLFFLPHAASTPAVTAAAPPPTMSDLLLTIDVSSGDFRGCARLAGGRAGCCG